MLSGGVWGSVVLVLKDNVSDSLNFFLSPDEVGRDRAFSCVLM